SGTAWWRREPFCPRPSAASPATTSSSAGESPTHLALAMSHHRLSEEHRRAESLRASAAQLELLDELAVVAGTGTGTLPDVFAEVSAVARKVLAHDALVLTVVLRSGGEVRERGRKA